MASGTWFVKLWLSLCTYGICYGVFVDSGPHDVLSTDPDTYLNTSQLITSKGYPCNEYTVKTEDGYLLYIYRIPYGIKSASREPRKVVFLQHGLLCSSADWVLNLANESLAFILADAGYDVWIGNVRGNTYGRRHESINPSNSTFWKFSWDEMAQYDLPAMIDKVLNITGEKSLYYIGHSQGTMIAFAHLSENKTSSQKIKMFIAMGPVTTVGHVKSPIRFLGPFAKDLEYLFYLLGENEFLPSNYIVKLFSQIVCKEYFIEKICENILFLLSGFDPEQLNITRLPVYIAHTPAGTSTQNIIHFAQMITSNKFIKFDYGSAEKNKENYGQPVPPEYYAGNVTIPVALFWAENDLLADPEDVKSLAAKLPHLIGSFKAPLPKWSHLDYLYGLDAPSVVYNQVLKLLKEN